MSNLSYKYKHNHLQINLVFHIQFLVEILDKFVKSAKVNFHILINVLEIVKLVHTNIYIKIIVQHVDNAQKNLIKKLIIIQLDVNVMQILN